MSRRDIAWSFPSGFHALGSVVVDLKRAVVPTNVRHFGLSVYSELLDIRRAGLHGYAPFFLLSLLFFLSVSFLLSPLSLSLSPSILSFHLSFFLSYSVSRSRTRLTYLAADHTGVHVRFSANTSHRILTEYLKTLSQLVSRVTLFSCRTKLLFYFLF